MPRDTLAINDCVTLLTHRNTLMELETAHSAQSQNQGQ